MSTLRVDFVQNLAELPDDVLSEITADGQTFASLEWYKLLNNIDVGRLIGGTVRSAFVVVRRDDVAVCVCPVLRIQGKGVYFAYSLRRYYFEHWIEEAIRGQPALEARFSRLIMAVNAYRRMLDWTNSPLDDYLLVGSPLSFRGAIPVSPTVGIDRSAVYNALTNFLQQYCRRRRLPLWFFCIEGENNRLAQSLRDAGCQQAFMFHDNVVDVEGYRRFGDYMQSFAKTRRKALAREWQRSERSGAEFSISGDIRSSAERVANLYAQSHPRSPDSSFLQPKEFWSAMGDSFGGKAELLWARERGKDVGFHMLLRNERRGEMWAYRMGRDEESPTAKLSSVTSRLCFYEPIRRAIALGYRRVWLGPASYEAKSLRGARQVPLYSYFWFPRRWDQWFLMPFIEQFGNVFREQIARAVDRPVRMRGSLQKMARAKKSS